MSLSLAELKKNSNGLLDRIKKNIEEKSANTGFKDERFWQPTFDSENGGSAVIRFLPNPDGINEMPYVKVITHYFKGPTKKTYRENSLRTLNKPDPVASLNYHLWQTDIKSNQEQSRAQKQRPRYYSNILVIKDPGNPENEGKVFLYEYGPAVYKLIEDLLFPNEFTDPDAEPINPFNVFEAPNLTLRLVPQNLGTSIVPNYNKSSFGSKVSEIDGDIDAILKQSYSLKEFSSEDNFKSYDELAKRLIEVLGPTTGVGDLETVPDFIQSSNAENKVETAQESSKAIPEIESTVDDEDDEVAALRAMLDD